MNMHSDSATRFLDGYPHLARVVDVLNRYLEQKHPSVFGSEASHPYLPTKKSKVIHDGLWGTNRFSWRELALIDSPIMQRLRDIHQVGLAFHVYPSARHSRFEHCLGAAVIASRIFDALLQKQRNEIRDLAQALGLEDSPDGVILRLKQELRLAALLHDTGHSLFSHTSERVYEKLDLLVEASRDLTSFVGKKKGAGEVLSFCLALTPAVKRLLDRTKTQLIGDPSSDDYEGEIDFTNVALIIVGRASHPFLQFLGDIVSSGFDADKLDYLLRDAKTAGLPLTYDIDRYLYDIRVEPEIMVDGEGYLEKLFTRVGARGVQRVPASANGRYSYYDTYRLRLSQRAMNVIEQILICKMMLFSYIYHHPKCRAAEGLLEKLLNRCLEIWRANGDPDEKILERFLEMTDASIRYTLATEIDDDIVKDYAYRIVNRLLPRVVYSITGPSATHAAATLIQDFLMDVHDKKQRNVVIGELEQAIGEELFKRESTLGSDPARALALAGVWVDTPKAPKFEDIDDMIKGGKPGPPGVPLAQIFPIREWTQAYEYYRYEVRIFAFSEYWDVTLDAAKAAMTRTLKISSETFYASIRRDRQ